MTEPLNLPLYMKDEVYNTIPFLSLKNIYIHTYINIYIYIYFKKYFAMEPSWL